MRKVQSQTETSTVLVVYQKCQSGILQILQIQWQPYYWGVMGDKSLPTEKVSSVQGYYKYLEIRRMTRATIFGIPGEVAQ